MAMENDKKPLFHLEIKNRLKVELVDRLESAYPIAILVHLFLIFVFRDSIGKSLFWPYTSYYMIFNAFLQMSCFIYSKNNIEKKIKVSPWLAMISATNSIAWGLAIFSMAKTHGIISAQTLGLSIVLIMYGYGVTYATLPILKLQRFYVVCSLLPLSFATFFYAKSLEESFTAYSTLLLISYLISMGSRMNKLLLESYKFEDEILFQQEKLKNVFNSIPGFMAIFEKNGKITDKSSELNHIIEHYLSGHFHELSKLDGVKEVEFQLTSDLKRCFALSAHKINYPEENLIVIGLPIDDLNSTKMDLLLEKQKGEYYLKMALLGEMAGSIAHAVNNPLAIIFGKGQQLSRLLKTQSTTSDEMLEKNQKMLRSSVRIANVIKSLKDFSSDQQTLRSISLHELVEELLLLNEAKLKNLEIDYQINYRDVSDKLNKSIPLETVQLLTVLLNNAIEACLQSQLKRIELEIFSENDHIYFHVRDFGAGIDENLKDKIFHPFFSTKNEDKNQGMGLAVSKNIAQRWGGDLTLESYKEPTLFQLKVPINKNLAC